VNLAVDDRLADDPSSDARFRVMKKLTNEKVDEDATDQDEPHIA
jgi:hypothetical protein